jgi:5'(3')-deoxyribonucleotidase
MIYVDMDGVLANLYDYISIRIFNKLYTNISPLKKDTLKAIWKNRKGFDLLFPEGPEQMFENLRPYPFNEVLIELIVKFGGEYTILSRPSNLDLEGTRRAKIKWVERHLSFCPPKEVLLVKDKTANGRAPGNVLIDDFDPFLEAWREKGGHAVEYKAWTFDSTVSLKEYMEEKLQTYIK